MTRAFLEALDEHEKQYVEILENRLLVPSRVEWMAQAVESLEDTLDERTVELERAERHAFYRALLERLNASRIPKRATDEDYRGRIRRLVAGRFNSLYERHQFTYKGT